MENFAAVRFDAIDRATVNPVEVPNRFDECKCFTSGFETLDREIGHFGPGVTVLSAEPGIGKSTLVTQIAINLAEKEVPVVFFSTELSYDQMASRIISNIAFEWNSNTTISAKNAQAEIPTLELCCMRSTWTDEIEPYLTIYDDVFTAEGIVAVVREQVNSTGISPFVIVDNLQHLQSDDSARASDSGIACSANLDVLCALGAELTLPILVVSNAGQNQYGCSESIEMTKESGTIEFDPVCLLQLVPTPGFKMEKPYRDMTLSVLKNRYGKNHGNVRMHFFVEHDTFKDFIPSIKPLKYTRMIDGKIFVQYMGGGRGDGRSINYMYANLEFNDEEIEIYAEYVYPELTEEESRDYDPIEHEWDGYDECKFDFLDIASEYGLTADHFVFPLDEE